MAESMMMGLIKVIQNEKGEYVFSGWYSDSTNQNSWFLAVDTGQILISDQRYGGDSSEYAGPLFESYANSYDVAPASASEISGNLTCHIGGEDIWMYETEIPASLHWQLCLGGTANERSTSAFLSSDSGYVVTGYTNSNDGDVSGNHGDYDWWLVKLQPGCSVHASFTYSTVGSVVTFTNTSVNGAAWFWDFGDGNTSTAENPVHTFPGLGTYEVCLTATASGCLPDTLCMQVAVCGLPASAAFTYSTTDSTVTFDNNSQHSNAWSWDFGDGTTSTSQNPTHTYTSNGTFEVCLVATYVGCSSDTICQPVTICIFETVAGFEFTNISSSEVQFTDTSPSAISWFWDFGDGTTSIAQNPTHTYTADGTYEICLTVSDGCGFDTACQTITICIVPTANFDYSKLLNIVEFVDESDNATGWMWDFGDGATSTTPNPTHTYNGSGTYTVCLVAINSCGMDTFCQDVTVECPAFSGGFTFTQSNDTAFFTDQSPNAISWLWDFGDGGSSSVQNPMHIYAQNGTFDACLIVSDGCSTDTICQQVVVIGVALQSLSSNSDGIGIYPNPSTGLTIIEFSVSSVQHVTLNLLNSEGKKVKTIADQNFSKGDQQLILDGKELAAGTYLLQLITPAATIVRNLIIQ
jgi:PKD repeat protein